MIAEVEASNIIPFLLYPWLVLSIGIYVYRVVKKRGNTDTDSSKHGEGGAGRLSPKLGRTGKAEKAAEAAKIDTKGTGRAAVSDPIGGTPTGAGGLVDAVIREELESRKAAERGDNLPEAGRSGLFAPSATDVAAKRVPVAEALAGIALPCDLAPIDSGASDAYRVCFVTNGHGAGEVGGALGDELERLGFTLRSENDTTVSATKGAATVRVVLHPDARHATGDAGPLFPSAPGGSVAVELTT